MIVIEMLDQEVNGKKLKKTYSNEDFLIRQEQTGYIYESAIDIEDSQYTYVETDEKIIREEENEELKNIMEGE